MDRPCTVLPSSYSCGGFEAGPIPLEALPEGFGSVARARPNSSVQLDGPLGSWLELGN